MQLLTPVPVSVSGFPITYDSTIFSLGSCFAEHISQKLRYFQFDNSVNPLGILFHPEALEKLISFAVSGKTFTASDVFFHNDRWHCFDAHSDLSGPDRGALLDNLNLAVSQSREWVSSASHFIITLGTAWAYRHEVSGAIVANCHKVPQREFTKELLSAERISRAICSIADSIRSVNPRAQIIFTISPVRHIKDGFTGNQLSKASLISGLHNAIEARPDCHYFPSYEIVMDELRDYRFYASDMLHPNQLAIDYIWEKFARAWISDAAAAGMSEVDAIRKALAHRPSDAASEQHAAFLASVHHRIEALRARLPNADFD